MSETTELDKTRRYLRRLPPWVMALLIAAAVLAVTAGLPQVVVRVWPGVNEVALVLGNLFLGLFLGSGGVIAFLSWHWRVRR